MCQPMDVMSDVLRDNEVCELLGISRNALRRLSKARGFPFTRVGIKRVYLRSEITKWIRSNQEPRASE